MERCWQLALMSAVIVLLAGCSGAEPGATPAADSAVAGDPEAERGNWNLRAPWAGTRQDATRDNKTPFKIFDNVYYVGLQTVCAYLIDTGEGLVLIDSTYTDTADTVLENIRTLGFDPEDLEYIFVTHSHTDHVGGAARIQEVSGARVGMALGDWGVVEGQSDLGLTQDLVLEDDASMTVGNTTFMFYLTPGHTPGSTSIEYQVQDGENSYRALSAGGLGMSMGPVETLTFLSSVERLKALGPWDVMIPNHPWLMPGTLADIENGLSTRGDGAHPGVIGSESIDAWFDSVLTVIHQKIDQEAQAE